MPAVNNIYEFRLFSTLFGQEVLNVYHYRNTVSPGSAGDLATQFSGSVIPSLIAIQNVNVHYTHAICNNLDDPGDFGDFNFAGAQGTVTGDCLPSYVCWAFTYLRATRLVRNGYKRIAGVSESQQADGVATSGALTLLHAVATNMLSTLFGTGGAGYQPIILHKQPGLTPDHVGYPIAGVNYTAITSQNTRKIGRGA